MERREALKFTAIVLGGSIIGSELFLSGCSAPPKKRSQLITDADVTLLDEIGETILPDTDKSPGAKAAHIGLFIKAMVNDCYDLDDTSIFVNGLETIAAKSEEVYGQNFLDLTMEQRLELLTPFDDEARKYRLLDKPHFFGMLKELTIWGYFSSEPGATKALRYNPVPGRFEGCIPYNGESAWA